MGAPEVLDIAREAVLVSIKVGAPLMLTALVVGFAISLLQALTQVQESTLAFVPKLAIMCLVLVLALPFMLGSLSTFTQQLAGRIASIN